MKLKNILLFKILILSVSLTLVLSSWTSVYVSADSVVNVSAADISYSTSYDSNAGFCYDEPVLPEPEARIEDDPDIIAEFNDMQIETLSSAFAFSAVRACLLCSDDSEELADDSADADLSNTGSGSDLAMIAADTYDFSDDELELILVADSRIRSALLDTAADKNGNIVVSLIDLKIPYGEGDQFKRLCYSCPYFDGINITGVVYYYSDYSYYTSIKITNTLTKSETVSWINLIDSKVADLISQVQDTSLSDRDQALAVHDYIALHCHYDTDTSDGYDFYPSIMLTQGSGVCQSYAYLFQYIMLLLGDECYYVTSSSMNHGWDMLKIGNEYYHIDITWDDPVNDKYGIILHTYFLRSDDVFTNLNHSWDDMGIVCDDTGFDTAYYDDAVSQVIFENDERYFTEYSGLYKYDIGSGVKSVIDNLGSWGTLTIRKYSGLSEYDGKLYYNTSSVIRTYDIDTGAIETFAEPEISSGAIYGSMIENGMLGYNVVTSFNTGHTDTSVHYLHLIHDYESIIVTEPDCENPGTIQYTCSECGFTFTETVPALGHTPGNPVRENQIPAVGDRAGSYDLVIYCKVCNAELSRVSKVIPVDYIKVSSIEITFAERELAAGRTTDTPAAEVLPENASNKEILWFSSDTDAATVDENGVVTALRYSTEPVTITAAAADSLADGEDTLEEILADSNAIYSSVQIQTRFGDVAGTGTKSEASQDKPYQYYFIPVYWAADAGITKGYDNVYFGVGQECTREDFVLFLYRMAGTPSVKASKADIFTDVASSELSSAFKKAIAWAVDKGITKGYSNDDGTKTFGVGKSIARKDAIIMLYRYAGKPDVDVKKTGFTDVDGTYKTTSDTFKAIAWAKDNKITGGLTEEQAAEEGLECPAFGCNMACLREQMITFIYRLNNLLNK